MTRDLPPAMLPGNLVDIGAMAQWIGWERVHVTDKDGAPEFHADGSPRISKKPRTTRGSHAKDGCHAECTGQGGITGTNATHQATWRTYAEVRAEVERRHGIAGVGFVFPLDGSMVGIDLDHVIDADGAIKPEADAIVEEIGSYAEWSPSGTGIHILCRGALPSGGRKRGSVEMYSTGRFFTFTGRGYGRFGDLPIRDASEAVLAVHAREFSPPVAAGQLPMVATGTLRPDEHDRVDDDELLRQMFASPRGEDIERIFNGGGGDDTSAGDLALCNHLRFWCNGDRLRVDALFRRSGRMRPKWDEVRYGDGRTYGQGTLDKAFTGVVVSRSAPSARVQVTRSSVATEPTIESADVDQWDPVEAPIVSDAEAAPWSVTLPEIARPGVIGDLLRVVEDGTEADPAAILLSLLAACGIAIGLGPRLEIGGTSHHARTHLLIVGRTAEGRKGEGWGVVQRIMNEAIGESVWSTYEVGGLSSGEGLIQSVEDGELKPGEEAPEKRRLVFEPEFARTIRVSRREANTLSSVIRQAWDATSFGVMTRVAKRATNVHLAIVGHITPEELRSEVDIVDQQNGLLNRFLVCYSHRRVLRPSPSISGQALRDHASELGRVIEAAQVRRLYDRDREADRLWRAIYYAMNDLATPIPSIEARGASMIARLSLLYALLNGHSLIRVDDLRAAVEVWWYAVQSTRKAYGERAARFGDPMADSILQEFWAQARIEGRRPVVSQTDVHAVVHRNGGRGGVTRALALLAEHGLLERVLQPGDPARKAGRPAVNWRITDLGIAPPSVMPRWLEVARG